MAYNVANNVYTEQVTVSDSATKLVTHGSATKAVVVKVPSGGSDVYIGGRDVTTSNGLILSAGESLSLDMNDKSGALHGVVASSTQDVRVMTVG